jgi:hypothetical protein
MSWVECCGLLAIVVCVLGGLKGPFLKILSPSFKETKCDGYIFFNLKEFSKFYGPRM